MGFALEVAANATGASRAASLATLPMSKVPCLLPAGPAISAATPSSPCAMRAGASPSSTIFRPATRYVVPDDVPFYEGSVADRELVDRIFAEQDIGAIMHFAGSIVVPESVEKPLDYYRNNTVASHALISAAVDAGVKHFVFSSTAAVYGEPERVPVDESVAKLPINPYGASKLMTERMLEDSAAAYPMNYAALRYFNVSGADPDGPFGPGRQGSTHLIKVAVEAAVGKRDHIDVFGTDYPTEDGSCVRDYIHVSDLAAAHVKALERLIEAAGREPRPQPRLRPRPVGARSARCARPAAARSRSAAR